MRGVDGAGEAATAQHALEMLLDTVHSCSCGAGYCLGGPKNADKGGGAIKTRIAHKNQACFLRNQTSSNDVCYP